MRNLIYLLIPEGTDFATLLPEQQAGIQSINGVWTLPMPSTITVDGMMLCQARCDSSFDPQAMTALGLPWEIIGMWRWDFEGPATVLVSLDEARYLERLAPEEITDEVGSVTYIPATLREVLHPAGWPSII